MNTSRTTRIVGFIGALAASGALVGAAVHGTGAYFTDSKDGTISYGTGSIQIDAGNLNLYFDDLLPGPSGYKTKTIHYKNTGKSTQDVWLVFPSPGSEAFTSVPATGSNPLGRYGHLQIHSNAGDFVSNNLSLDPGDPATATTPARVGGYNSSQSCFIDADGHVGSGAEAANPSDKTVPYCAPRPAILLQKDVPAGGEGDATIQFGFTKILRDPAAQGLSFKSLDAKFQIVATQQGVRPGDPNN